MAKDKSSHNTINVSPRKPTGKKKEMKTIESTEKKGK